VGCLVASGVARAFPVTDPANPGVVTAAPVGPPDQADLRNQLQQHNDFLAPTGGGWTFAPRITVDEILTDNVLQTETDRRYDFITTINPGITILGNSPRAQVTFDYAPLLNWYARTPSQTGVSQQLAGTALITVVPDEVYLDARVLSGVVSASGGLGGFGGSLTPTGGVQLGAVGQFGGNPVGVSKQNQTQFSSLSVSPYWLHRFGDIGTTRIGYSISESSFSDTGSFLPLFFPTGSNNQSETTNEVFGSFQSGEILGRIQDAVTLDASNSTASGAATGSSTATISNRTDYAVNDWVSVYGTIGYENLSYGGTNSPHVADMTWGLGATLRPNPDSEITLGYGRQDGITSFNFSGYYALTARTTISASYATALQTQLQQIQNALNLGVINQNGTLINSQTGAQLFVTNPALGVQAGVFETKTFTLTATTTYDRDQFSLSAQEESSSPSSSVPGTTAASSRATVGSLSWTRQIHDDLTLYATASYSTANFTGTGTQNSIGLATTLQYLISETVTGTLRYAFYDQRSATPGQNVYQNLLLIGVTKRF
jgi:uncharacterized protein (PEP-CTERM system associated)